MVDFTDFYLSKGSREWPVTIVTSMYWTVRRRHRFSSPKRPYCPWE